MLVDINLLPQKEKKSLQSQVLIIILFILFVGATSWIGIDYYLTSSELAQKETALEQEKKLVEVQQQQLQGQNKNQTTIVPLMEKIDYVRAKDIEAVALLQHIVALLPERGYFLKYEYKDRSTISIEARFDTLEETSHYLYELTNSKYLTQASIESMETTNFEELAAGEDMTQFEGFLPRYHAQYKLKFNHELIKELKGEDQ